MQRPNTGVQRMSLRATADAKSLAVACVVAVAFLGCSVASANSVTIDPQELRDIAGLFRRSDTVAIVAITDAAPDPNHAGGLVAHGTTWNALKGVLNGTRLTFLCPAECTVGGTYIVFLDRADKTYSPLQDRDRPERFTTENDFLRPAIHVSYPLFRVTFDCVADNGRQIVVLPRANLGIPDNVPQGPLRCINHGTGWGAAEPEFRQYLTSLAVKEGDGHR